MKLEAIEYMLEAYGIDRILEDNRMSLAEAIDILVDLGYLELEMYQSDEELTLEE